VVVLPLPYILNGRCYQDEGENMVIMPCLRYEDSPAHRRFLPTAIAKFKLSPALLKEYRDRHEGKAVAKAARDLGITGAADKAQEAKEEEVEEEEEVEGERRQAGEGGEWEEGVGGRRQVPRIKSEKVTCELLRLYDTPPPPSPAARAARVPPGAGPGNEIVSAVAAVGEENEVKESQGQGGGNDSYSNSKRARLSCPVIDSK
jgi:hypothetical protein